MYVKGSSKIQLSVIVPALDNFDRVLDSVKSIALQADPIGTEIIVVDSGALEDVETRLSFQFLHLLEDKKLRVFQQFNATLTELLNFGVKVSKGKCVAFLMPGDLWEYGRLIELWPILDNYDFILSPLSDDYRMASLSTAVVRKGMLQYLGGFTEAGVPSVWEKCYHQLEKARATHRYIALPAHNILLQP